MRDDEDWRAYSWQRMLDQAGKHTVGPVPHPKANESVWRAAHAARDLRTADEAIRTPFNRFK